MLAILGGLDPTGGAGVLRDFHTARRVSPTLPTRTVITAWTRQGHGRPASSMFVGEHALQEQLTTVVAPRAVKIGLLPADAVDLVRAWLERWPGCFVVLDPVLWASDGGVLGEHAAVQELAMHASLLTPNRHEADALGWTKGHARPVLVKGGHADDGDLVRDVLHVAGESVVFERSRQPGPEIRGTGCALATAIAAFGATGHELRQAVAEAIAWLDAQRPRAVAVGRDGHVLE